MRPPEGEGEVGAGPCCSTLRVGRAWRALALAPRPHCRTRLDRRRGRGRALGAHDDGAGGGARGAGRAGALEMGRVGWGGAGGRRGRAGERIWGGRTPRGTKKKVDRSGPGRGDGFACPTVAGGPGLRAKGSPPEGGLCRPAPPPNPHPTLAWTMPTVGRVCRANAIVSGARLGRANRICLWVGRAAQRAGTAQAKVGGAKGAGVPRGLPRPGPTRAPARRRRGLAPFDPAPHDGCAAVGRWQAHAAQAGSCQHLRDDQQRCKALAHGQAGGSQRLHKAMPVCVCVWGGGGAGR